MTAASRLASVRPLRGEPWYERPEADSMDVRVSLEDGAAFTIVVETPNMPGREMRTEPADHLAGDPTLFVRRADRATVESAARALAEAEDGRWLRAYATPPRAGGVARVEAVAFESAGPGVGAVKVSVSGGRVFTLLACTPRWFEAAFARLQRPFYFGPPMLFARELSDEILRGAADDMARLGDGRLNLYDAPGLNLPALLEEAGS